MNEPVKNTVLNLIDLFFTDHPEQSALPVTHFPILETLSSGDYVLTRTLPDGTVFQAIIDKDTGDFQDTCRPGQQTEPTQTIDSPTNG